MLDKLYVIPTYKCNLSCPHCDLHKKNIAFNTKSFFKQLNNIEAKEVILFGGEPSFYQDRLAKCLKTNKITSISTNLLFGKYIPLYAKYNLDIATSWNPLRFSEYTENIWLHNLHIISEYNRKALVLITLTPDLLKMPLVTLNILFKKLEETEGVSGVLFEPLISNFTNQVFYDECDEWLCNIYKNWSWKFNNFIIDKLNNWNCNCSNIMTLEPNGILRKGCPQVDNNIKINEACYTCKLSTMCNPCYLQQYCTFPKKLFNLIKE